MTLEAQHKTFEISGNTLHYWQHGSSSRPTIILVHGFTGDHRGFYKIVPYLTNYFTVITLDLPGFGLSKIGKQKMSINFHAETVAELIQKLNLDQPPIVVGHSYGSLVVSKLHAIKPHINDEKSILISPVATQITFFDSRYIGKLISQMYFFTGAYFGPVGMSLLKSRLVTKVITRQMLLTNDKELKKEIFDQHIENTLYIQAPKQNYKLFREINKTGIVESAPSIHKRILIISGDKDGQCPMRQQKKAVQAFRRAQLVELSSAGHLSHYEEPESIADSILSFLNKKQ